MLRDPERLRGPADQGARRRERMQRATLNRTRGARVRASVALAALLVAGSACMPIDSLPFSMSMADRAVVYEAVALHQHAVALFEQGQIRDAITLAAKAAELLESKLGPDHPDVAIPLRSLAVFQQTQGAYADAESLYARVLAIVAAVAAVNPAQRGR